jgi:Ca2+-binding EF-hand superfamily protein
MRSWGRCALLLLAACGPLAAEDGSLTRDEAARRAPRLARHFDAIDSDGDGRIGTGEVRAWRKSRRGRGAPPARSGFDAIFRRADADGDGALSREEAAQALPRIARKFERIDADRDGRLTPAEVHAWLDARRAARLRSGASAR